MKRVTKFEKGGDVEMTAAERRRQNIERINQRRATNREQAAVRSEIERFNERLRQGTLTADDMRRMGAEAPRRQAAPAPSMQDAVRLARPGEAPRPPADAMRDAVRPVGPSAGRSALRGPGIAGAAGTLLALGPAAVEAYNAYRNRPITGEFERSMDPEGSNEAADAERERQASQRAAPQPTRPATRPAARPAARPRMSEADRLNQMELDRIDEARRGLREDADRRANRGFFERMGIRRTNETGEGAPSTGSVRGDIEALGRALGFKKGGAINGKGMHRMPDGSMMKNEDHATMKKGNKAMMYREGGMIKPKAKTAMKKGGAVKAPVKKLVHGGKVHGPKKMMKGGMTSKPKKMMGGGRAMYAKGGMAKGCK